MKKLLLKFFIIFLLFLSIFQLSTPKSLAATGCCSKDTGGRFNTSCAATGGRSCASGIKACDTNRTVSASVSNADIDEDGTNDEYNPDCFIPIVAPKEVRITDFGKLFSGVVAFLLLVAFILAFFFLILGGISWLTSGGDKAAVETARNKIIAAIVGLIIVAATWALFQLVGGAIGFNILQGFEVPRLF